MTIEQANQSASLERRDCLLILPGHRGRGVGEPQRWAEFHDARD